jgi:diguanylate cyclase (GGDEF)-like protein
MTVMIGLNTIIAALLAFTGALSIGASLGMRGNRPMTLFGITLLLGSVQTIIMGLTTGQAQTMAAALFAPPAYALVALGISQMQKPGRVHASLFPVTTLLIIVGATLVLVDAPYRVQIVALELAAIFPAVHAVREMIRRARPTPLDATIIAGLCTVGACNLIRVALALFYYGPDLTPEIYRASLPETTLLAISGLTVPPLILLLIARNVADALATYQQQSERDALTGLFNRRGIDALSTTPSRQGGAVIFCDIDHFKAVNDLFGHQTGDEVIRSLAGILSGPGYPAGRMGGEEFAVVLNDLSLADAVDLAEMYRARCALATHGSLPPGTSVTASFGVACFAPGQPPDAAFAAADRALYKAKRDGRNCVVSETPTAPGGTLVARQVA